MGSSLFCFLADEVVDLFCCPHLFTSLQVQKDEPVAHGLQPLKLSQKQIISLYKQVFCYSDEGLLTI